jgi:DNA-directed RNA polymerase specialized sigma subunit
MREIQMHTKAHMEKIQVPSIQDAQKARAQDAMESIRKAESDTESKESLAPYVSIVEELVAEGINATTIAAILLKEKSVYKEHIATEPLADYRKHDAKNSAAKKSSNWKQKDRHDGNKKKRYTSARRDDEYAPRGDVRGVSVTKVTKKPGRRP